MKINIYILLAAFTVFVSCGKEKPVDGEYGEKVVIQLSTATRSDNEEMREGDAEDREVASLRLLAYNHKTGILYKNYKLVLPKVKDPQTIEILTGRYDLVFIANEDSDTETAAILESLSPGSDISALAALAFPASAFSGSKPIPMVTCREVVIVGDRKYIDTNQSDEIKEGIWPVELERLGVRLDAEITFNNDQSPDGWELILLSVPKYAYILPAPYVDDAQNRVVERWNEPIPYGVGTGTGQTRSWSRIVIPENVFDPATNVANAVRIGVRNTDSHKEHSAPIGFNLVAKNYTLPRNVWVDVDAEIAEEIILGPISVTKWGDQKDVVVPF